MKNHVSLAPCGQGWTLHAVDGSKTFCNTLADAADRIARDSVIHLALPTHALVVERLRLPATQPDELRGMVHLHWEKTLPVSTDEIAGDFTVLHHTANESTVLTVAAFQTTLENLCRPLIERGLLPGLVTAYLEHIASACPAGATVLAIYPEHTGIVFAAVEDKRPGWVHVLPDTNPANVLDALPQLLLTAGLAGISTVFDQILIAADLKELKPALQEYFETPTVPLVFPPPPFSGALNLLPAEWKAQGGRDQRFKTWRRRLAVGGLIYLLVGALAGAYLFSLKRQSQQLDREIGQLRPQLVVEQAQQSRSTALAPAIDPHRYAVELLFLLQRQIPSADLRLTEFDQSQQQWRIVGEAPSANLAIDYVQRIRQDPDLAAWQISAGPPQLLTNERAQFSILGKP